MPHLSELESGNEFLKAEQAFEWESQQDKHLLTIKFTIAPGYYLYRQHFKFESNGLIANIDLPKGIDHQDQYFGLQQIYKEQLSFTLQVQEATSDASLSITYQGCAEKGLCYPPITKIIQINPINIRDTLHKQPKN